MRVDRFRELALWKSRPTARVDRQRIDSLLQVLGRPWLQRSDFRPLAVDRTGRPAALTDPNCYIFLAYKFGSLVIVLSQDFMRALNQFFPFFQKGFLHKFECKYFLSKGKILSRVLK